MPAPIQINIPVLSRQDKDALRRLIEDSRRAPKAAAGRSGVLPEPAPQAPEVYLALVPTGGIAANGQADCEIFRMTDNTIEDAGFSKTVSNFGIAIPAGYSLVVRDKFGTWWAVQSQAASTTDCDPLTIQEIDLRCESGLLNQYKRTITLFPVDGCYVKEPGAWVIDKALGCCDSSCTPTGTGTSPNEFAFYCLTPNPYAEVVCGGLDITRISQSLCLRVQNLQGSAAPGDTVGCASLYAEILQLNYVGHDGGPVGAGRTHTWQGTDSGTDSCSRSFTLSIQETTGGCSVSLSGYLGYSGGADGIGSFGALGPIPATIADWNAATTYNSSTDVPAFSVALRGGNPYISATDAPNLNNDPLTSTAWRALSLESGADGYYSLGPDTLFQFVTIHDTVAEAGQYTVFPCVGTQPFTGTGTSLPSAASECFGPINHAQYLSLLDLGYVLSAGPFGTESECLAVCTPPSTGTGTGTGTGAHSRLWYCMQATDGISYGCLLLTLNEIASLLLAGWTLLSGPYSGESACNAGCAPHTGTGTGTTDGGGCPSATPFSLGVRQQITVPAGHSQWHAVAISDGQHYYKGINSQGTGYLAVIGYNSSDPGFACPGDTYHAGQNNECFTFFAFGGFVWVLLTNSLSTPVTFDFIIGDGTTCPADTTGTGTGTGGGTVRVFGLCTDTPASIVWTFTSGDCFAGTPITLNYFAANDYRGSASVCSGGATMTVRLFYDGSQYHIYLDCGGTPVDNTFTTIACSPFAVSGNFSGNLGATCGTFVFGTWAAG